MLTIEDYLDDAEITWEEFCQSPYPVLSGVRSQRKIHSIEKQGTFLFDRKTSVSLLNDEKFFEKSTNFDLDLDDDVIAFFSKWIFFRNDEHRHKLKAQVFGDLNRRARDPLQPLELVGDSDQDWLNVRRYCFSLVFSTFFDSDPPSTCDVFEACSELAISFQNGRSVSTPLPTLVKRVKAAWNLQHKFQISPEYFESAVTNAMVDGIEPMSDLFWNALVLHENSKGALNPQASVNIARTLLPSFRYAVRHATENIEINNLSFSKDEKIFVFLSSHALAEQPLQNEGVGLPFGHGSHSCAGRGMVQRVLPEMVRQGAISIKIAGVSIAALDRSMSLGAEGIEKVHYR